MTRIYRRWTDSFRICDGPLYWTAAPYFDGISTRSIAIVFVSYFMVSWVG